MVPGVLKWRSKTKPLSVVKSCGPKLVPFLKTVAIFFVLFGDSNRKNSIVYCIFKCLPIVSLILFVLLHGMGLQDRYSYSRRILLGLIFSMVGDVCLVWKDSYFIHGILMFAIAQVLYASAFGLQPLNPRLGALMSVLSLCVYLYLRPGLTGVYNVLAPIYIFLIFTMVWRAIARVRSLEQCSWTHLSGLLGAICFAVSDCLIGINVFLYPVPFSQALIMSSYYAAQFGIAVSVVDQQIDSFLSANHHDVTVGNGHLN